MIRHPLIGLKYCRLYIVVRLIFHTIIMTSTIHLFVFAYWAIAVATLKKIVNSFNKCLVARRG